MERIIQKASELLKRCQTVTFATVNGEGFPRPVPVKTLRTDDALTI
ncbi:pyridoxamine 5'-phosphate oxidase family protein [Alistipes ihumii]